MWCKLVDPWLKQVKPFWNRAQSPPEDIKRTRFPKLNSDRISCDGLLQQIKKVVLQAVAKMNRQPDTPKNFGTALEESEVELEDETPATPVRNQPPENTGMLNSWTNKPRRINRGPVNLN